MQRIFSPSATAALSLASGDWKRALARYEYQAMLIILTLYLVLVWLVLPTDPI